MLSLISFSFIFCIMTSSIMQLNASELASSCLNFTRTRDRNQNHVNNCTEIYRNYTINFKAYSRICMQCTIIYTKIAIDPNCSMAIKCVILIFDNNGVLETFFKDRTNSAGLSHLFLDKVDRIYYPSVDIIVNNYNITDITSNYIGHIANIDAPNTNIHIKFIKRSPGLLPLTVTDETYYLRFPLLTISVQCDDSNSWATYAVYGKNSTPTRRYIERNCIELQSTTKITTLITTTPETTTRSTTLTTSVSFITTSSSTTEKLTSTTSTSSKVTTITSTTTRQKSPTTSTPSKLTTITIATTTKEKTEKTSIEPTTTTRKILTITSTARRPLAITTTTTKFPAIATTASTTTKASLSTRTTSSSPRTTKTILTSMKTASTITATTTTKASLSTRTTSSSPRTTKTISTSMKTTSTITAITSTLLTITIPSTTSFTTTIISEIETSTATTDNSLTMSDTSAINTSPSPMSTLTSEIIELTLLTGSQRIIPTAISQITSTMIAQTSQTTASTSSFIPTTSELMEGIEKISSRTTIQITLKTETILSAVITRETPTVMSRSSTISTNTGNLSFTSTTSTQRSQKSRHILLYILFSLLSVIICVTIAALIAYLFCCRRQPRYFIGEDSSTLLDTSNRDTHSNANNDGNRPESASNTSSSLSSTLYDETKISTKPNINFGQIFDDDSF